MEYVHRFWTTIRRIVGSLSLVAAVAAHCSTVESVRGAPITFAFVGQVTEIDKSFDANFDLPFAVAPGDIMTGRLEIQPMTFATIGTAPSLTLSLGSITFSATNVPVFAVDNNYIIVGSNIVGPNDSISVDCSQLAGCSAKSTSVPGILLSNITVEVWSRGQDVVNGGESLTEVDPWNRLPDRGMGVVLSSANGTGTITIASSLGALRAIPEPCTATLIAIGFSVCAIFNRRRLSDRVHHID